MPMSWKKMIVEVVGAWDGNNVLFVMALDIAHIASGVG